MPDPKVQILITADGSQASREVSKSGAGLLQLGVTSVTAGNLLADLGRRALEVGKDLARFPLEAAAATGRYVEELQNLTTETGLSADELQAYDVILARTGGGLRDLSGLWKDLSRNVLAARDPQSEMAAKFRQLGIELNGSEGPNQVLQLVAERLQALPDGFQKNTLAVELLGQRGAKSLAAFKEGLAGAAAEAQRLGTVLGSEARAKAAAFDSATDDLDAAWKGLTHQIGVLAAPALTNVAKLLTEGAVEASKYTAELTSATSATEGLAAAIAKASPFTARGLAPQSAASGTKELAGGAVPDSEEFAEALAASGRGVVSSADDQQQKGAAIVLRTQQTQFDRAHMAELQPALASTFDIDQVVAREKVEEQSRARPDLSGLNELQRGVAAIRELMPELDANEALQLVEHNLRSANSTITTSIDNWQSYRDGLSDAAESARALEQNQTELFQTEAGFIGATEAARRLAFTRIAAEEDQKRQMVVDTFGESERAQQKLIDLETQSMTQRMAVVRQYPTFWEQQLQAIVNSNSFSLGSIVSTWTGGLATAAVQHRSFNETIKAAWQSTQTAVLSAGLNTLVQWGAQLGLSVSREIGLTALLESTKTALVGAGEAAQTGIVIGGEAVKVGAVLTADATIVAANAAAAGASAGIWAGAAAAVAGFFGALVGAFGTFTATLVSMVSAVGAFVMGVLSAIAGALTATVFGIPWAGAILVGVAAIAAALAATGNLGFREGGVGDFGTGTTATLHGREAIIPLDSRGKRFMNQLGVGGGAGEQRIIVQVGDDVLVEKVLRGMPRMVRMRVGAAFS